MKFILRKGRRSAVLGRALSYIDSNDDRDLLLEIKEAKPRRSLPQNDLFHALCSELAEATGYTPLEIKNLVKSELHEFEVIETPFGKVKRFRSSADWNKVQMGAAIETLYRYGADVGHSFREAG